MPHLTLVSADGASLGGAAGGAFVGCAGAQEYTLMPMPRMRWRLWIDEGVRAYEARLVSARVRGC